MFRRPLLIVTAVVLAVGFTAGWLLYRPTPPARPPGDETRPGPTGPDAFEDVTARTGVTFSYRNGEASGQYTLLETLGGGVAVFDFDGDGRLDVFATGGGEIVPGNPLTIRGSPCRLYRNLGDWKFEDVTTAAGLDGPWFYTHGAAVADYDRDGWPDLLVTGWGRVALFHNVPAPAGGRRFVEVGAAAGVTDDRWSAGAAWGDLDADGFPDLYVCNYLDWSPVNNPVCPGIGVGSPRDVCPPERFGPLRHHLFRNNRDGTFTDVTASAPLRPDGRGLGVVVLDLDGDERPDIYVANDAGDNFLYLNRGGMRFKERGLPAGVAVDEHGVYDGSMGVDAGDYDGTGRPSLVVANFQHELHALYRNVGGGRFRHHSLAAGLGRLGREYVAFGTSFLDYDGDGWEDLVFVNGHVHRHPVGTTAAQRPVLLRNEEHEGRRQYREPPGAGGAFFRTPVHGRGLAVGDLDDDGWPDLVVSRQNAPLVFLRNAAGPTSGNHWLGISLAGRDKRDLVGTVLTLEVGGRTLTKFVKGGGSYLSASDPRVRFGLGPHDRPGQLTVRWPGGPVERHDGLTAGRYWMFPEGGRAEALNRK